MRKQRTYTLVKAGNVFVVTLIVIVLTTLGIYFWGLGHHRTFFENSMMSTTVLAAAFFSFTTIGLYRGFKIKDDVGNVKNLYQGKFFRSGHSYMSTDSSSQKSTSESTTSSVFFDSLKLADLSSDGDDDILDTLVSIIVWIVVAVVLAFAIAFIGDLLIISLLAFVGMLYWIFFRALRLVFKNSNRSKGDLLESMKWGFFYTLLYSGWIYGFFFIVEFIKH